MSETASRNDSAWVTASVGRAGYRTEVRARTHAVTADEPAHVGGTDAGATPYELLLGALSSCTAITLRMYADRKKWPLERVVVKLRTARSHEADCEHCETEQVGIGRLERRVEFAGPLSEEQKERLLAIADRCPVKQSLERGIQIVNASS
jgi:putative redox protein